jgi:hypothetical protein
MTYTPAFVGDSGAGGTKGLVIAPATGDATKFLKGNATWATPAGGGGTSVTAGVFASLPAAGTAGNMYFATDIDLVLRDNGTSWDRIHIGSEGGVPTAPPSSGWTTTTLGSATIAASLDGRLNTCPSAAGDNWRIEYRTLSPTSNYTFTVYLESALYTSNFTKAAIILRNSGSGSFVSFGPSYDTGSYGGYGIQTVKYSNPTTGIAIYSSQSIAQLPYGMPKWLRIRDDGTNRISEFSDNGIDWIGHYSVGRTDYITPDQIGWGTNNSSGQTIKARLRSWSVV